VHFVGFKNTEHKKMQGANHKQSHTYLSPSIINVITQALTIGKSCSTYTGNGEKLKRQMCRQCSPV